MKTNHQPKFAENPLSPVEFAFTSGGVDYFQYLDPFEAPCLRALTATNYYEVFRKRTTRELDIKETNELLKQAGIIKDSIKGEGGKINLVSVFEAIQQIEYVANSKKTRLDLIFVEDLAYELASVVFFDETESPFRCNMEYCKKKIERWKKDETLEGFFLRQPLTRLIPFTKELGSNLPSYSKMASQVIQHQSSRLSSTR